MIDWLNKMIFENFEENLYSDILWHWKCFQVTFLSPSSMLSKRIIFVLLLKYWIMETCLCNAKSDTRQKFLSKERTSNSDKLNSEKLTEIKILMEEAHMNILVALSWGRYFSEIFVSIHILYQNFVYNFWKLIGIISLYNCLFLLYSRFIHIYSDRYVNVDTK